MASYRPSISVHSVLASVTCQSNSTCFLVFRYIVDSSERFVPTNLADNGKFSHALGRDDFRATCLAACVPPEFAPFTDMAGIGRLPEVQSGNVDRLSCLPGSTLCAEDRRYPSSRGTCEHISSGKVRAERAGGKLHPATVLAAPRQKKPPVRRSESHL